jgi:threonine dehydrogenase-like Zn-dependent dehydrogenase
VGLAAIMAAKAAGASKIIAIDIEDKPLTLARDLGTTHIINSKRESSSEQIKSIVPIRQTYSFLRFRRDKRGYRRHQEGPNFQHCFDSQYALIGSVRSGTKNGRLKRDTPFRTKLRQHAIQESCQL